MPIETEVHPPVEPITDKAHRLVRTTLAAIPVAGSTAVEVFSAIVTPPIERRMRAWTEEVTNALNKLLSDGVVKWEDINGNENFQSRLIQATTEALKTHQHEKLQALKNAVVNSAAGTDMDDDEEEIVLNLVAILTPSHIHVLDLFLYPQKNTERIHAFVTSLKTAPGQILVSAFKGSGKDYSFWQRIFDDLVREGLLDDSSTSTLHNFNNAIMPATPTPIASRLFELITEQ